MLKNIRKFWWIILILGILIFLWGGSSIVFAVKNYEMVINDTAYAPETSGMVLESCMLIFRKGVLRAVCGLVMAVGAGFVRKR